MKLPCSALFGLVFSLSLQSAERKLELTVSAGDWDRRNTIVSFELQEHLRPKQETVWHLRGPGGGLVPLQVSKDGTASFLLDSLDRGGSRKYELAETEPSRPPQTAHSAVTATRKSNTVQIRLGDHPVLTYQAKPGALPRSDIDPLYERGGYIHPVVSPSGKIVTDDYPPNHIHHHGIWFPWTKTQFEGRTPDFWNMGQGKGRVEFVALDGFWSGPVHAGVRARHRFVDLTAPEPRAALNETWTVKVYNTGDQPYRIFELVSIQECATSSALVLPKYYYGGLGVRGNWEWNGPDKAFFLTSAGETDRVKGNETRGRWCHMGGRVDGELTGIAILGHPSNFRAPQPMRLHPAEPFFCFAPSQLGDWEITPGKPYISRYRFVVQDGKPDAAELDRLWTDYAHPPVVVVTER